MLGLKKNAQEAINADLSPYSVPGLLPFLSGCAEGLAAMESAVRTGGKICYCAGLGNLGGGKQVECSRVRFYVVELNVN